MPFVVARLPRCLYFTFENNGETTIAQWGYLEGYDRLSKLQNLNTLLRTPYSARS